MILEETLNKLIRDTVSLILGGSFVVIKGNQDAPRPAGLYADVITTTDIGLHWEQSTLTDRDEDLDIDQTIEGQREIMLSVGFYRTGAKDAARRAHIGFIRESVLSMFNIAKVGLIRRSEVRAISEAYENGWEERTQFDIFLNVVGSDADIIRSIQSVQITGNTELDSKTYIETINIV